MIAILLKVNAKPSHHLRKMDVYVSVGTDVHVIDLHVKVMKDVNFDFLHWLHLHSQHFHFGIFTLYYAKLALLVCIGVFACAQRLQKFRVYRKTKMPLAITLFWVVSHTTAELLYYLISSTTLWNLNIALLSLFPLVNSSCLSQGNDYSCLKTGLNWHAQSPNLSVIVNN